MSRGYCSVCRKYADTGKFCDSCGTKLIFSQTLSDSQPPSDSAYTANSQNTITAVPDVAYSQTAAQNTPLQNSVHKSLGFKNMDRLTVIGIVLLTLYSIVGLAVSLFIAKSVIKDKQVFLVKINVSYFWLWLFVIINFLLLIGTLMLRKNKSVLCMVGQGILWLVTLALTFGVKDINYDDMNVSWSNGIVSTFGMNTEVSRVLGVSAFSIGHLFVIVFWIAALICVAAGRTKEI